MSNLSYVEIVFDIWPSLYANNNKLTIPLIISVCVCAIKTILVLQLFDEN